MSDGNLPDGLLLSRDLFFVSKVTGTAQALGFRVVTRSDPAVIRTELPTSRPRAILVDLGSGDLASSGFLAEIRSLAAGVPMVAFGSHVDAASLEAARQAGCDEVMPRSRFSAELPEILKRLLHPGPSY